MQITHPKMKTLDCLVMKKAPACPEKSMKSGVDRVSHSGENRHHFCCAPARTTYGSPADKYNLFLFFPHFTCTFHSWNIKTSHRVPVNPWHLSIPCLRCAAPSTAPCSCESGEAGREGTQVSGLPAPRCLLAASIRAWPRSAFSAFPEFSLCEKMYASWLQYKPPSYPAYPSLSASQTRGIFRSHCHYIRPSIGAQGRARCPLLSTLPVPVLRKKACTQYLNRRSNFVQFSTSLPRYQKWVLG